LEIGEMDFEDDGEIHLGRLFSVKDHAKLLPLSL
jgi:hypothetical protein